jgi:TPR repeat protein
MKWRLACLLATIALPGPAAAQDTATHETASPGATCEAAYAALPRGTILDLLDPAAPMPLRQAALDAYQRLAAMRECPEFGYTLGQLYRHGEYLPGNLLPQDLDKARALIRPMAESGYLPAYADLAEMEMRHAQARGAMQWTQLYLHYVEKVLLPVLDPREAHFQHSAYNGNLLARTELVWRYARPALPRKLVREDFHAYLAQHGSHVEQRMRERQAGGLRRASAQDGGPIRITSKGGGCAVNAIDRIGAASAAWIVEVLPSGEVGRVVLENFVPKASVADTLAACLAHYRFAPFEGHAPATIRVSMVMGSPEGAAISRKRRN